MFALTLSRTEATIFMGLLLLWASLLFGGFIFGRYDAVKKRRMPRWTCLASSFVLVVCGWFWFAISRDFELNPLALWFAIGMTLGFVGDLFMAQIFPLENHVLGGIGAFGLGHIAYIIGMTITANQLDIVYPRWDALLIWWIIALIGWFFVVYFRSKPTILHYAALPYSILLASTAGIATGLFLENSAFMLIAIGAALFLVSDLILAAGLFERLDFAYLGDMVWFTYGPGQMLIVCAILLKSLL
jgi:hypothetical protein